MDRVNLILNNKNFINYCNIIDSFEEKRNFCKHDLSHFLEVARIMYIINLEEKLFINKEIIYASALLHDIGRAKEYLNNENHNIAAIVEINEILLESKYNNNESKEIIDAIVSHNCDDDIILNNLLRRADKLSRNCFACKSYDECKWPDSKKNKGVLF